MKIQEFLRYYLTSAVGCDSCEPIDKQNRISPSLNKTIIIQYIHARFIQTSKLDVFYVCPIRIDIYRERGQFSLTTGTRKVPLKLPIIIIPYRVESSYIECLMYCQCGGSSPGYVCFIYLTLLYTGLTRQIIMLCLLVVFYLNLA